MTVSASQWALFLHAVNDAPTHATEVGCQGSAQTIVAMHVKIFVMKFVLHVRMARYVRFLQVIATIVARVPIKIVLTPHPVVNVTLVVIYHVSIRPAFLRPAF
jgi:hypothetical protein